MPSSNLSRQEFGIKFLFCFDLAIALESISEPTNGFNSSIFFEVSLRSNTSKINLFVTTSSPNKAILVTSFPNSLVNLPFNRVN